MIKNFNQFVNESNNSDTITIWEKYSDNLPSIFKRTIYRVPSVEELEEVNSYNLDSKEIQQGFGYTIIGRGMLSFENKQMIIESIKRLCEMFPDNVEYKAALTESTYKHTLNKIENVAPKVKKGQKVNVQLHFLEGSPDSIVEAHYDSAYNDYETIKAESFSFLFGGDMMMTAKWDGSKWTTK